MSNTKGITEKEYNQFIKASKKVSALAQSMNMELMKLGTPEKAEPGFAFVHKDFAIKAVFEKKGINFQSNVMSLQVNSATKKLQGSKDLMLMYSLSLKLM